MAIVLGVDFGTLSVRATVMDTDSGATLGHGVAEYPLKRSAVDPLLGGQAHDDHMDGLVKAIRAATLDAAIDARDIAALACDTTGSSVVMVDANLLPLCDYYLWCDHRAHQEAEEITALARAEGLEALDWCGGVYSHEWGYAKLLHFLRHNPDKRTDFATALEHCDMVAATLCGITAIAELPRSICAMGHKWMWGAKWGGLPSQDFLTRVDPLLEGVNAKLGGRYLTSDNLAGYLSQHWADQLGLTAGIPIPIGGFDAHWDAIGAGATQGDIVNVVGTSTCIIGLATPGFLPVPGLCGVVPGSVVAGVDGVEAGQSATGDVFSAIARRAGRDLKSLSADLETRGAGSTGLMRLNWDNGDRTILVRSNLGAITLGWDLNHEPEDELHAAIEGMAMNLRIIYERIQSGGMQFARVINAGGIPGRNAALNQIYADVLDVPIEVPASPAVGVGSCIFASVAAGVFATVDQAQKRLCPPTRTYNPRPQHSETYQKLLPIFTKLYQGFGANAIVDLSDVLPTLRGFRVQVEAVPNNQPTVPRPI